MMATSAWRIGLAVILFSALAVSAQETYFPKGALASDARGDSFRAGWYSQHLKALQEPSLLELGQDSSFQSYRFIWLRTFHHPVVVRINIMPDGTGDLTVKVADGAGGYDPGKIIENTSHTLKREDIAIFEERISATGFWRLPSYQEDKNRVHLDGSQWIIEGIKDGKYHVVDRWTPAKGEIRELGLCLALQLAKLKIPKDELY
jgi:hypothetical protein